MHKFYQSLILWRVQTLSRLSLGKNRVKMSSPFPITVISILFPSRRTNSPGKELCYLSVGRKNRPSAIFPSDGRIDSTLKKTIAIASSVMKTRLSIDTGFKIYRTIIAKTKNSIADDDFIVYRGDINMPGTK